MNSSSRIGRDEPSSTPDIGDILDRHRWIPESLAAKFSRGDDALQEDLEQEGLLALTLFVEEYEPGPKAFASAAYDRVKFRILNYLRDNEDPADTDLRLRMIANESDENECSSLDAVLRDESPSQEDVLLRSEREELVREVVESLPTRERKVVELLMFEDYSQPQVATILNVSQQMVSKIFAEASEKVRVRLKARGF